MRIYSSVHDDTVPEAAILQLFVWLVRAGPKSKKEDDVLLYLHRTVPMSETSGGLHGSIPCFHELIQLDRSWL